MLLSIFFKGHYVSLTGWSGVALACTAGNGSGLHDHMMGDNNNQKEGKK